MRKLIAAATFLALAGAAGYAQAMPAGAAAAAVDDGIRAGVTMVHHRPGHWGGPPHARRYYRHGHHDGWYRGHHYGWYGSRPPAYYRPYPHYDPYGRYYW
ncbi:hypothetical protein QNA08_06070 [Chelatococcus sp. SYSU_G07232]|uniref:Uncharacterized protein n=1 Tax=Chelatococcus albus TaxID=3047466 RepID=A0ABT7AGM8_9HYPH|nr:hypothetical protein [Chelatococcus sp. SYSU_G07232]MDJ1157796.1 hypothetical protein [Chelatococcus sp. SYSU_G07232]